MPMFLFRLVYLFLTLVIILLNMIVNEIISIKIMSIACSFIPLQTRLLDIMGHEPKSLPFFFVGKEKGGGGRQWCLINRSYAGI